MSYEPSSLVATNATAFYMSDDTGMTWKPSNQTITKPQLQWLPNANSNSLSKKNEAKGKKKKIRF